MRLTWDAGCPVSCVSSSLQTSASRERQQSRSTFAWSNRTRQSRERPRPLFNADFDTRLSAGPLHTGSVPLLHGRVPADRLPPAHPRLQHHAAGQHPPQMTACPAGGGGGRRRPLPALESRRAPRRGHALYCQPMRPPHSDHFRIKTGWEKKLKKKKLPPGKIQPTRYVLTRKKKLQKPGIKMKAK